MLVKERLEALEKLSSIAALGGVNMVLNQRMLRLEGEFSLPGNRSQICFVRPVGKVRDKVVVTFFSGCLRVKKGFLSGMSKEQAMDLLRRNESILFARYGLMSDDEADMVVASADYLLDTLDPEEFEHCIWHVAMAADAYEKEKGGGQDDF
jgi:hypothetical protein